MARKLSPGVHNVNVGGKRRKVRVLKNGQWRFLKGSTRTTKTKTRSTPRRATPKKTTRRTRTVAKNTRARAKPKPTVPLGLLIPGLTGTFVTIKDVYDAYDANKGGGTGGLNALRKTIQRMVGYDIFKGLDEQSISDMLSNAYFSEGWAVGEAIHKGVGGYMGVNKALGAAHVPYVRV